MKKSNDHQNASEGKNRIKIRRSSVRSSLTHISNDNQSSITKSSLGQSHDGPYKYFPNENLTPMQTNHVDNNDQQHPVEIDRRTSKERAKVTRLQRNSISIPKEDKPTISFVPRKSLARIERLHGEDLIPLNDQTYPTIPQQQRQISNRR